MYWLVVLELLLIVLCIYREEGFFTEAPFPHSNFFFFNHRMFNIVLCVSWYANEIVYIL